MMNASRWGIEQLWSALYGLFTNADLASFASIVGLGLSIYVVFSVRDIRTRVLLRIRAPEAIKELTDRSSKISSYMLNFDSALPSIHEELALCSETLKNLRRKVSGETKRTVKVTIKRIDGFMHLPIRDQTRDAVREVYVQILVSSKAVQNLIADFREEP